MRSKPFGAVLRGSGPPVESIGEPGDLYIDSVTSQLFAKRGDNLTDPWGHYLFVVPAPYATALRWFCASPPPDAVGRQNDYCLLWGGYPNYGLQPTFYGPRGVSTWPTPPTAVAVTLNPLYTAQDQHGI